jgi:hypothetical protein
MIVFTQRDNGVPAEWVARRLSGDAAVTDAIEIRNVAPSDFDEWLPLWDGYNAFYKRVGPTALSMEVTRTTGLVSSITMSRFIALLPKPLESL